MKDYEAGEETLKHSQRHLGRDFYMSKLLSSVQSRLTTFVF